MSLSIVKSFTKLNRGSLIIINWFEGITDTKRAFFMGNALVVGVIEKIGKALNNKINSKNE